MINFIDIIMISALTNTDGKARINIWDACFLNTYQSELKELSNIKGGRNISNIPRGSMLDIVYIELPIIPND